MLIVSYLKYSTMATARMRAVRDRDYSTVNSELPEVQHYVQDEGCQR